MKEKTINDVEKEGKLEHIKVDLIDNGQNVRTTFDPVKLEELKASVKEHGVKTPIWVAVEAGGRYELIAGARRLRVSRELERASILAMVFTAEPEQRRVLQIIENLQREAVNAVQEARGFADLLKAGLSKEDLARRVSKKPSYVGRAVDLLKLPAKVLSAIETGKLFPEHGFLMLGVPEEKWPKLAETALTRNWRGQYPTVDDFKREIETRVERDLKSACFPQDREVAGLAACTACPFNTANQDELFKGMKGGKCTNGACFTKKTNGYFREYRDGAASRFAGLKFAGFGVSRHDTTEVGGGVVLTAEESKNATIKKLRAKFPEKFGFAVLKPSMWGDKSLRAVLVCFDREVVAKLRKVKPERQEPQMSREDREREAFVRNAVVRAVFGATAKAIKSVDKRDLVAVVLSLNGSEEAFYAVGVESTEDLNADLMKLSMKELWTLAVLCTFDYRDLAKRAERYGVKVGKVSKEARSQALVAFKEMLAAQSAEGEAPKAQA